MANQPVTILKKIKKATEPNVVVNMLHGIILILKEIIRRVGVKSLLCFFFNLLHISEKKYILILGNAFLLDIFLLPFIEFANVITL